MLAWKSKLNGTDLSAVHRTAHNLKAKGHIVSYSVHGPNVILYVRNAVPSDTRWPDAADTLQVPTVSEFSIWRKILGAPLHVRRRLHNWCVDRYPALLLGHLPQDRPTVVKLERVLTRLLKERTPPPPEQPQGPSDDIPTV